MRGKAKGDYHISHVDKVVVCCSEVLQAYYEDGRMKAYIKAIDEFYFHPNTDLNNSEEVKEGLERIVRSYQDREGFHHVLTELAFLKIRYALNQRHHGIIPVVLNGDGIKYLPLQDTGVPLWLKPQEPSKSMIQECQVLHRLLFNLLHQLYENQHTSISAFQDCYNSCVAELSTWSISQSQENLDRLISIKIASTMKKLASSLAATIRTGQ
jgi:hypothetical protein